MNEETSKIVNRLKSIEGHVRGVEKMVEEEAYCIDIVKQIEAIKADSNLSKREKFEKTREVREGQEESIKKLLTPEQYAKRQENIEKIKTQKEN